MPNWFAQRHALLPLREKAEAFRDKFKIYALWAPNHYRDDVLKGADELADYFIKALEEEDPEQFVERQGLNVLLCEWAPNELVLWFKTGEDLPAFSGKVRIVSSKTFNELVEAHLQIIMKQF